MTFNKRNTKTRQSTSFFCKHLKTFRIFIIKALYLFIALAIFTLILYKSYYYIFNPINLVDIPLIKNNNICFKKKFNQNDGFIFSNQDKAIYNSMQQDNQVLNTKEGKFEKIIQDFSHKQIFDIVQDIRKDKRLK